MHLLQANPIQMIPVLVKGNVSCCLLSWGNSLLPSNLLVAPLSFACKPQRSAVRWRLVNTRRQHKLWQPHFRENICLEVLSFLIFNVSPGAPRQHMFPACPEDMAASVPSTLASHTNASSHRYCLPQSFRPPISHPPIATPALKQMAANYNGSCALKVQVTNSQQQRPPPDQ